MQKVGILPFGRPTFDVPLAEEKLACMLAALGQADCEIVGSRQLLMDGDAGRQAVDELKQAGVDQVLVLQVTFTDALMVAEAAAALPIT